MNCSQSLRTLISKIKFFLIQMLRERHLVCSEILEQMVSWCFWSSESWFIVLQVWFVETLVQEQKKQKEWKIIDWQLRSPNLVFIIKPCPCGVLADRSQNRIPPNHLNEEIRYQTPTYPLVNHLRSHNSLWTVADKMVLEEENKPLPYIIAHKLSSTCTWSP